GVVDLGHPAGRGRSAAGARVGVVAHRVAVAADVVVPAPDVVDQVVSGDAVRSLENAPSGSGDRVVQDLNSGCLFLVVRVDAEILAPVDQVVLNPEVGPVHPAVDAVYELLRRRGETDVEDLVPVDQDVRPA